MPLVLADTPVIIAPKKATAPNEATTHRFNLFNFQTSHLSCFHVSNLVSRISWLSVILLDIFSSSFKPAISVLNPLIEFTMVFFNTHHKPPRRIDPTLSQLNKSCGICIHSPPLVKMQHSRYLLFPYTALR